MPIAFGYLRRVSHVRGDVGTRARSFPLSVLRLAGLLLRLSGRPAHDGGRQFGDPLHSSIFRATDST